MVEPKIRFKKENGSDFPGWKEDSLDYLCDYVDYRGKTPKKTDSGIFLVTAKNIRMGYIDYKSSKEYISDDNYEEVMHRGKPIIGDVLFTTEAPCGMVAQVNREDIALAQRIIKYRAKDLSVLSNEYLKYILMSNVFQNALNQKLTGGTVKGIKGSVLHKMKIIYPCLEEQQKIADFLSSIDDVIVTSEQEVANLEMQKKAVMKKIFSQEVRFKKDDGSDFPEWEENRIGDISETYSGGTPKVGTDNYYNGTIPFIRSGEIHSNFTELYLSEEGIRNSSAKMIFVGDIIMALYGATSGEIDISKIEGAINQAILCIKPNNNFNKKFIVEIFRNYKDKIIKTYLQGGQGNLSAQIVKDLVFSFPCLEEQQLIADFLSNFDEAILSAKKELELWKELKKGLLQQMFV